MDVDVRLARARALMGPGSDKRRLRSFLGHHTTLVLATADGGGNPWACPVFFAVDPELDVTFVSPPESRHATNLAVRPWASAAIAGQHTHWRSAIGVQLEGPAVLLQGPDRRDGLSGFMARFRWVAEHAPPRDHEAEATLDRFSSGNVYRITPIRVMLVDGVQGLDAREVVLDAPAKVTQPDAATSPSQPGAGRGRARRPNGAAVCQPAQRPSSREKASAGATTTIHRRG
ncbi:MAG: pyridoxamine 5'-phosphate oxidase family protein [Thermoleophilia bacterium]